MAQYVTMGAATLYAASWLIGELASKNLTDNTTYGNVLIALTSIGGVAMGLLYIVFRSRSKR